MLEASASDPTAVWLAPETLKLRASLPTAVCCLRLRLEHWTRQHRCQGKYPAARWCAGTVPRPSSPASGGPHLRRYRRAHVDLRQLIGNAGERVGKRSRARGPNQIVVPGAADVDHEIRRV